jgi:hypothetical protein
VDADVCVSVVCTCVWVGGGGDRRHEDGEMMEQQPLQLLEDPRLKCVRTSRTSPPLVSFGSMPKRAVT